MSIEGQGHFFTIYFPGFVCFVLYKAMISGERLQDHWSSGFSLKCKLHVIFFFDSVQRPFQYYFNHIETSQSVGGAKREYPGKTT